MMKVPVVAGSPSTHAVRTTPLTGVVIGTGISLLLWVMIVAIIFAVR